MDLALWCLQIMPKKIVYIKTQFKNAVIKWWSTECSLILLTDLSTCNSWHPVFNYYKNSNPPKIGVRAAATISPTCCV